MGKKRGDSSASALLWLGSVSIQGKHRILFGETHASEPHTRQAHQRKQCPNLEWFVLINYNHPMFSRHLAKRVTVACPGIVGYADGERYGALPLTIECVPHALRVLA